MRASTIERKINYGEYFVFWHLLSPRLLGDCRDTNVLQILVVAFILAGGACHLEDICLTGDYGRLWLQIGPRGLWLNWTHFGSLLEDYEKPDFFQAK